MLQSIPRADGFFSQTPVFKFPSFAFSPVHPEDARKGFFYDRDSEVLAWVARSGAGCPVAGVN